MQGLARHPIAEGPPGPSCRSKRSHHPPAPRARPGRTSPRRNCRCCRSSRWRCRPCRRRARRWTARGGTRSTSSSSPATPTSIIPASRWRSSAACWRRPGFRVGDPQPARLADRASRGGSSAGRGCSSRVSAGNMDSMINHYTANKKVRNDDAYSPGGRIGLRPDRATLPYCQRAREAFPGVPVIAGGVEASLRRLAHYDYWSDKVRRSILLDCKADLRRLRHGRAADRRDRPAAGRRARRSRTCATCAAWPIALGAQARPPPEPDATRSTLPSLRRSRRPTSSPSPRRRGSSTSKRTRSTPQRLVQFHDRAGGRRQPAGAAARRGGDGPRSTTCPTRAGRTRRYSGADPRLRDDQGLGARSCAAASAAARSARSPRTRAGSSSRGRRSRCWAKSSKMAADPEFKGDRQRHRRPDRQHVPDALHAARGRGDVQAAVVRPPDDLQAARHRPRPARRADEARPARCRASARCSSPAASAWTWPSCRPSTCDELAAHHVGGHLKVAPEHTDPRRARADEEAGDRRLRAVRRRVQARRRRRRARKQYLVPYFIASHPGSDLHAMIDLAVFLKRNGYRPDQVQDFIPAPFDIATCMYYTGLDPFTEEAGLHRQAPARPQAAAGPDAVLQAGELLRGPRGAACKAGRADLIGDGLRLPDPGQPAQGRASGRGWRRPTAR